MNNTRFIESVAISEHLYWISEEREVLLLISRDFHLRSSVFMLLQFPLSVTSARLLFVPQSKDTTKMPRAARCCLLSLQFFLFDADSREFKSCVSVDGIAEFFFKRGFLSVIWKFKQIKTRGRCWQSTDWITPASDAEKPAKYATNRVTIILWRENKNGTNS